MPSKWIYHTDEIKTLVSTPPVDKNTGEEAFGFIYLVTEKATGKWYVGCKQFKMKGFKQVKGKKKRCMKDSKWQDYCTSNAYIQEVCDTQGVDKFNWNILAFCRSKSELAYLELKEQLERDVMFSDDTLNGIINVRINKKHLEKFKTPFISSWG